MNKLPEKTKRKLKKEARVWDASIAKEKPHKVMEFLNQAEPFIATKTKKQRKITKRIKKLLSLPEVPAPDDYQKWEAEYLEGKYSCR